MNDTGLWLPASSTKEDKVEGWWTINRKHDPPLARGATPLIERCMRIHGWHEPFARRTLKGYRQFMELKSVMNDWQETKLAAPVAIQQMWEQHILDNLNYTDDCFLLFGRVIGHDPDARMNDRIIVDRIKTTRIAFQARYGNDMDPDVWDFGPTEVESMIYEGDDHLHQQGSVSTAATNHTPRGRLPVATIERSMPSVSPRSRSLVNGSEDDNTLSHTPIIETPTINTVRDRSPGPHHHQSTPIRASPITSSKPQQRTPKSPSGNDPITIFLRDQGTGEETYFSLRYRSTLRIVFTVFAERKGLSQENLKFSFNGQTLTGYETPYSLGLEDRARIDVQIGQRRG